MRHYLLSLCLWITLLAAPVARAQDAAGAPEPAPPADIAQNAATISAEVEDDRGFLTRFLERNLSGAGRQVVITGFRGALSSRATFDELTIADDDGIWITLRNGAIQWNRSALFSRRIEVQELSAVEIDLPRLPGGGQQGPKPEAREFSLPELPVGVRIERIHADRVSIGQPVIGEAAVVTIDGSMDLAGGEGTSKLTIGRVDGKRGGFALDAGFSNASRVLRLDLALDEDKGGLFANLVKLHDRPAVKAEIKGEGPLSDFAADIKLATDGQDRVSGRVSAKAESGADGSPGNAFRAELAGDVASLLPPDNRPFFGTSSQLLAQGWRGADGRLDLPVLLVHTDALNLTGALRTTGKGAPEAITVLMTLGEDAGARQLPVRLPLAGEPRLVSSGRLEISFDAAKGSGWTARGRIGGFRQGGNSIGEITLDGGGTLTLAAGGALDEMLGKLDFGAQGIALADPGLQEAMGDAITGQTDFALTPGNALELSGFSMTGADYGVYGDLRADGLRSGMTVSGTLDAAYQDLSRLSKAAGRPLSGQAAATVSGLYTALSRGFDAEINIKGQDITVDQDQIDPMLAGESMIALSVRRDETGITLNDLTIDSQRLTGRAEGTLATDSSDIRAQMVLKSLVGDVDAIAGELIADATVTGPADARKLTLSGRAQDLKVGIKELDGALRGHSDLQIEALNTRKGLQLQTVRLDNPQLQLNGGGDLGRQTLDAAFDITAPDLSVLGRGMAGSVNVHASARMEDGARVVTLTGTGDGLRLGQKDIDGALTGQTQLNVTAAEKDGVITLRDARLRNDQMTASVTGTLGDKATDLAGRARVNSLAAFGRGWRGALELDGTVKDDGTGKRAFEITGTGQNLALGPQQVAGALTGTTHLALRGAQDGRDIRLDEARIVNDQTEITAQGTLREGATDLTATLAMRNLASLGLGWRGSVNADAAFRDDGTGARRLTLDGVGRDLGFGQAQVDGALAGETKLTVRGSERGGVMTLEQATIDNARLNAEAHGTIASGASDVTARIRAASLAFLGRGIRGGLDAEGRLIERGQVRSISAGGTANGLGIGNARVDGLLAGQTRFDLAAQQSPQGITIQRLNAQNGQFNVIASGDPQAALTLDATLNDLALLVPGFPGPVTAKGTMRDQGATYGVDVALTAPGGTRAQVTGTAAKDMQNNDLRIAGISDAAIANPFLRVRSIEGPVDFDLRLRGPAAVESLTGRVNLPNARLSDPKLGIRIDNLAATADFDRGRIAVNAAGNVQGGGRVTVVGPVDLRSGTPAMDLTVTLDNAVAQDPNLYRVVLDGTVRVQGSNGPLVSGRIMVNEAEIRIPSTGLGGARAIPEIHHVRDTAPVRATRAKAGLLPFPSADSRIAGMNSPPATPSPNPARLDLTVDAPNQVHVRGRGVDAELGGQIRLTGTARNVIPVGQLQLIRGRVDLLGKRFDLTEGLIQLQGSLIPVIRLVAETVQDDVTTRIIIDGEVRSPDINFESSPELPEEEVLSHLLFGRGLDTMTPLQAAQLANALAVLAGRGSEGIVSRLRSSVGLDDLDLQTDDQGRVSVRAGKYLSRNVYTDVSVDDEGKSKIQLNLDVSKEVTARGSVASDGESKIGVYYDRDY